MACEEIISVIGELKRKRMGSVAVPVRKGLPFADMAKSGLSEKKAEGKGQLCSSPVVVCSKQKQMLFGFPMAPHAYLDKEM